MCAAPFRESRNVGLMALSYDREIGEVETFRYSDNYRHRHYRLRFALSFAFRPADDGIRAALRALLESWADRPGRITFLANVLLYMPLGFFAIHALGRRGGAAARMVLITLFGAFLSVSMELLQYFDAGRITDAPDVYANTLGTLIGAAAGSLLTESIRWSFLSEIAVARVPILLLVAWVGYRLFPFVPTLDLHKYWSAIKPAINNPVPTHYDLFRYTAMWLGIGR